MTSNAGSTGLNLQFANTVISVDSPWTPAVLEQRIGRVHRMGQKTPVPVFVLVIEVTFEGRSGRVVGQVARNKKGIKFRRSGCGQDLIVAGMSGAVFYAAAELIKKWVIC